MNILIINSFYYPNMPGGAEHSVKNLCEELVRLGHTVSVLCTDNTDTLELINGVNIYRIKNTNIKNSVEYYNGHCNILQKIIYRGLDLHGYLNKLKLDKVIENINPDVVHINNIPGIGLSVFEILHNKRIPVIFTARDYYPVCVNSTLMNSEGEICRDKKRICNMYESINKKYISKSSCITAPSQFSLDIIKKSINKKDVVYECINNSIDIDEIYINQVYESKKIKIVDKKHLDLVFLGRLEEHKGVKVLIEYMKKMNNLNIKLHIAGDGELSDYVKNLREKNIFYHGKLGKSDLDNLLKNTDIMVAPSLWYEPFGRIVIDAYKYSMPVISTGMGGLKELIKDGKTGYIVDFKNIKEFEEIIKLYENKNVLLDQMKNCKNEANRYSNNKIVKQYEELYKKVLY